MSLEKAVVIFLALIFLALGVLNPAIFKTAGNIFAFGVSSPQKIDRADLEKKINEFRISIKYPQSTEKFVAADVYSRYPLNLKDEFLAGAGSNEGVKLGGAAIWNGILVGRVKQVAEETSLIQTIFDPNFSLAVRIGKSGADSLLKGGVEPKLTLIPKNSASSGGETVYSASGELPFGLVLGVSALPAVTPQSVFAEASLVLSYSPSDLRYIFLEKSN